MPGANASSQRHHHHHNQQHQSQPKQSKIVPRRHHSETNSTAALEKRRALLFRERRILVVMTAVCCLASAVWIAALSTDFWIVVTNNSTDGATVLKSHLGVWRGCVINRQRSSNVTAGVLGQLDRNNGCTFHNLDDEDQLKTLPAVARTIVDYRRTIVALAGLSLLCLFMGVSVSFYTFRNGRYTFKRLAGCMHLMTAATVLVLIEVVTNGTDYTRAHMLNFFPAESIWYHGFSFYLAWLVCTLFGASGIVFIFLSRKKKSLNIIGEDGNYLPDDDN